MALRVIAIALTVCVLLTGFTGCSSNTDDTNSDLITVEINGNTFHLEPAADDESRMRGLGGRSSIPDDGGMIFIFPEPQPLSFLMRDCLVDIDIVFIDARGRITAVHEMAAEPLQRPEESLGEYEQRLRKYMSGVRAQYAIELRAGWLKKLDLNVEDKIELETDRLKAMAQ